MKVLGVQGGVSNEEIVKYLTNPHVPVKKIMVTYDSLPRLVDVLNSDEVKDLSPTSFNLLVDEVHKLIEYLDGFKVRVCMNLLENAFSFNSVSFMTATTTPLKYLPPIFQQLETIEYVWEGAVKPKLLKRYVKSSLTDEILKFTIDKLDHTSNELYFFYNEKLGVVNTIKKLLKCKPELGPNDINIVFAKNKKNQEYFQKKLGKGYDVYKSIIPNGFNNKRINFISSTAYEGLDFIANMKDRDCYPLTVIISNPSVKSSKTDIGTDMPQIMGRFRAYLDTKAFPRNDYYFLYSSYMDELVQSEEEYSTSLKIKESQVWKAYYGYKEDESNTFLKECLLDSIRNHKTDFLMFKDEALEESGDKSQQEPLLNEYAYYAHMSKYSCMNQDYVTNGLETDIPSITNKLEMTYDTTDFELNPLDSKYLTLLNRRIPLKTFVSQLEEFEEERELYFQENDYQAMEELRNRVEDFILQDSELESWLAQGLTPSRIKNLGYERSKIRANAERIKLLVENREFCYKHLGFRLNNTYTKEEIKERIQDLYSNLNICFKEGQVKVAKATDIEQWYDVKSTTSLIEGVRFNSFTLINKKQTGFMVTPYTDSYRTRGEY